MSDEQTTSTEDAILATVPELGDETPYGELDTEDSEGQLGPTQAEREATQDRPSVDQSATQQESTQTTQHEEAWYQQDNRGNLVDNRGNVAIAAGQPRRLFDQARREARQYEQQARELQQRITEFERLQNDTRVSDQALNGLPNKLGMSEQDVQNAFKFWNGLRVSPVETVNDLINHARTLGHKIDGVGQGIDPEMIKAAVTEVMQPVLNTSQQQAAYTERRAEVQREVDTFFSQYEDARIHEPELAALIQRDPTLTLHKAYSELRDYAYRHGLNWSQPLHQQSKQSTNGNGGRTTNDPSLVSGHNIGPAGRESLTDKNDADEFYSPEKDWRSIVAEQMSKAGGLN